LAKRHDRLGQKANCAPSSARHAALILMTSIPQMAVDFSLMLPRPGVSDKREAPASLADGYPRVISLGRKEEVFAVECTVLA